MDLGLKIKATPALHANNEVTLQLEFEIRALAGGNVNGIPIISNRTLTQTMRVREDQPTSSAGWRTARRHAPSPGCRASRSFPASAMPSAGATKRCRIRS